MTIKPRAALDAIRPYVPGATPAVTAERALKLASNENPFGPSPRALDAARIALECAERYPNGGSSLLRARLAERHGVAPDQVLLGTGSDEIFYQLTRAYLEPGRRVVISMPWPMISSTSSLPFSGSSSSKAAETAAISS